MAEWTAQTTLLGTTDRFETGFKRPADNFPVVTDKLTIFAGFLLGAETQEPFDSDRICCGMKVNSQPEIIYREGDPFCWLAFGFGLQAMPYHDYRDNIPKIEHINLCTQLKCLGS